LYVPFLCIAAETRAQELSAELRVEIQKLKERAAVAIKKEKKKAEAYKDKCLEAHKKVSKSLLAMIVVMTIASFYSPDPRLSGRLSIIIMSHAPRQEYNLTTTVDARASVAQGARRATSGLSTGLHQHTRAAAPPTTHPRARTLYQKLQSTCLV
jgi:hypothetical protein